MKIAVTGANGHVGVNLCKALISKGHTVRAMTHKSSEFLEDLPIEKVTGDVLNRDSLKPFLEGMDMVFHLAARISITGDPDGSVWKVNSAGTRNMVEIAQETGVQKFIHFSSIHAFREF